MEEEDEEGEDGDDEEEEEEGDDDEEGLVPSSADFDACSHLTSHRLLFLF